MASSLRVVDAPTVEPLTLGEAKKHLRVTVTDDDDYITDLIPVAREQVEIRLNRALLTQTLRFRIDRFPDSSYEAFRFLTPGYTVEALLANLAFLNGPIYLPKPPLQSVTSIQYLDTGGATRTMDQSTYVVDADAEPARIVPANNQAWPSTLAQEGSVWITFVAGYGDTAAAMPVSFKQACKLWVSHLYENREPVVPQMMYSLPKSVDDLLWGERVLEF